MWHFPFCFKIVNLLVSREITAWCAMNCVCSNTLCMLNRRDLDYTNLVGRPSAMIYSGATILWNGLSVGQLCVPLSFMYASRSSIVSTYLNIYEWHFCVTDCWGIAECWWWAVIDIDSSHWWEVTLASFPKVCGRARRGLTVYIWLCVVFVKVKSWYTWRLVRRERFARAKKRNTKRVVLKAANSVVWEQTYISWELGIRRVGFRITFLNGWNLERLCHENGPHLFLLLLYVERTKSFCISLANAQIECL